ncbi:MAG: DUF192 domain-containing protein [Acidimicrobiales bacterium]
MAWLLRDTTVLASVEIADTLPERLKGLLGRRSIEGVLLLRPARAVHTLGMRFPIDVAYCAGDGDHLTVLKARTMKPHRVAAPVRRANVVLEAEAGALDRWGVRAGDCLVVRW